MTMNPVKLAWDVKLSRNIDYCKNHVEDAMSQWRHNTNKNILSLKNHEFYENLKPCRETSEAVIQTIVDGKHNGYAPSVGYTYSREAVANFLSHDGVEIDGKDVLLCSGCASAIDHCITVLADGKKGQHILIPRPGYFLYKMLAESMGIEARYYDLLPDQDWNVDLYDLERKIDENTAAILINNPLNPCGSVYSADHLLEIVDICFRHKKPIIADESFELTVYPEHKFTSFAALNTRIPVLICSGLSKNFLVPGWRLGWIIIQDPIGAFEDVRKGLNCLTQRIIGSNTLIQGSLPEIFNKTPISFNEDLVNCLRENAQIAYGELIQMRGLKPYMPKGTMFIFINIEMDKFKDFDNSFEFLKVLYEEESVLCVPSEMFGLSGYMRIAISIPTSALQEGLARLKLFCARHYY